MGWADELLGISDAEENKNNEHLQYSRTRLDTRKWLLSKILHKVYGDRRPSDDMFDGGDAVAKLPPQGCP